MFVELIHVNKCIHVGYLSSRISFVRLQFSFSLLMGVSTHWDYIPI